MMHTMNPGQLKKLIAMVVDWSLPQLVELTQFAASGATWADILRYCKTIG